MLLKDHAAIRARSGHKTAVYGHAALGDRHQARDRSQQGRSG